MKAEIPTEKAVKINWKKMIAVIMGIVIGMSIIVFVYLKFLRYR